MNKVTIKIQTGTSSADAERMIKLVADTLPDREIEIVYCDDPAMNVKLVHLPAGQTLKPGSAVRKISDDARSSGGEFDPHANPMGGRYGRD